MRNGGTVPVQLTIGAPTITKTKVYDGNTTAAVTAGALAGVVGGDTVTVSAAATYDNANVGTGKTITVVYTLAGADAGKYTAPANTVVTDGVIEHAQAVVDTVSNNIGATTIVYVLSTGTFDASAETTTNWTLGGNDATTLGTIQSVSLSNENKTATITVENPTVTSENYTLKPEQAAMNSNFLAPAEQVVTLN